MTEPETNEGGPLHKCYIVWINWGAYEGWKIGAEADTWDDAQEAYLTCLDHRGGSWRDVLITEYCPFELRRKL